MGDLHAIIKDLKSHATKEKAAFLPYFLKQEKDNTQKEIAFMESLYRINARLQKFIQQQQTRQPSCNC